MHEGLTIQTQNEATGAATASGGGRAPIAFWGKNYDVMHEY